MQILPRIWIIALTACLWSSAITWASNLSLDEEAREALQLAAMCSQDRRECGGFIYKTPAGYVASDVQTSDKRFGVSLEELYKKPLPAGWEIVADYHTHVCTGPLDVFFSIADTDINLALKDVGYILSMCDGNIHRFDPKVDDPWDEEIDYKSGAKIFVTIGHVSGWINPRSYRVCTVTHGVAKPLGRKDAACRPVARSDHHR